MRAAYFTSATLTRFSASVYLISLAPRALVQPTASNEKERRHGLVILKSSMRQRGLWGAVLVLALFAGLAAPPAQARAHHSDAWARDHFAGAERMREALNGKPPADRGRRDYQRVLNAYRSIYLGAPNSSK